MVLDNCVGRKREVLGVCETEKRVFLLCNLFQQFWSIGVCWRKGGRTSSADADADADDDDNDDDDRIHRIHKRKRKTKKRKTAGWVGDPTTY